MKLVIITAMDKGGDFSDKRNFGVFQIKDLAWFAYQY